MVKGVAGIGLKLLLVGMMVASWWAFPVPFWQCLDVGLLYLDGGNLVFHPEIPPWQADEMALPLVFIGAAELPPGAHDISLEFTDGFFNAIYSLSFQLPPEEAHAFLLNIERRWETIGILPGDTTLPPISIKRLSEEEDEITYEIYRQADCAYLIVSPDLGEIYITVYLN